VLLQVGGFSASRRPGAARSHRVKGTPSYPAEPVFRWGSQVDVRAIRPAHAAQVEGDDGEISDRALAQGPGVLIF
jgi:hypothetical protein